MERSRGNGVNRRRFLQTTGVASAILAIQTAQAEPSKQFDRALTKDNVDAIEESIKVHFGSGFNLLAVQSHTANAIAARIEHLQNEYSVISSDLTRWNIVESTDI